MEEINRVTVKIYGQEYTIAGKMPREHIIRVADYVDGKMKEIADGMPAGAASSLAVLTAVNAADEYFRREQENEELHVKCEQLEKDSEHYETLWEEVKKSFAQYKESAQSTLAHQEQVQKLFNEKTVECSELSAKYRSLKEKYDALKLKNEDLTNMLQSQEANKMSNTSIVKELEAKCRDVESSFFDLQMENIRLKGELDKLKKSME